MRKKNILTFILFFMFIICSSIFAQWDKYPTYDEYINMMSKFETDYPNLCKIEEIGESVQGRKLLVAKVSDNVTEEEAEPEILYNSTIHGDELGGYVFMLRLIDTLLSSYSSDPQIRYLVDNIEIWIAPLCNPDGTYRSGNNTVSGAGRYNANNRDLNRNFPCPCGNNDHQYAGIYDSLEPETKALLDFENKHNFVMSADIQAGMEAAIYPWHCMSKHHPDENWFKYVAQKYAATAQAHSPDSYFVDLGGDGIGHGYLEAFERHGTLLDSRTYHRHCRTLKLELSLQKMLNQSSLNDYWEFNHRSLFNYMENVFYGFRGKTVNWLSQTPVEGKVKVSIKNHDNDSSFIRSQLPHGDFYRPIYPGKYTLTFKFNPYSPDTLYNIQLRGNELIKLKIKMQDIMDTSQIRLFLASPTGGEIWERGKSYNIIWYNRPVNFIQIFKDSVVVDSINLPSATMDAYLWQIPSDFPIGNDYRIRVNGYGSAISDSTFSIIEPITAIDNHGIKPITTNDRLIISNNHGNMSIRYTIPYSSSVKLEAYNIKGKLVKVITDKFMHKGSYSARWDSERFGSGVYFIKLSANGFAVSKKVTIIK